MKILEKTEVENFEFAWGLKCAEHNGDMVQLWSAEAEQVIGQNLIQHGEEGYYLLIRMSGLEILEWCKGQTLSEACESFNTVLKTIKS